MELTESKQRLLEILKRFDEVAVAVSGGVDSMLLAYYANIVLGDKATMFHAISAAVPPEATARVQSHTETYHWTLEIIDANEFADDNYTSNPVNRCFFCKTNLYDTVAKHTSMQIVSGANLDDLGDYRPGLKAADDYRVRHPLVEAKIDKLTVRALARLEGLDNLAELPAAPCLSSRITTGIPVTVERVKLVYEVEKLLKNELGLLKVIRCRLQTTGVEIQLDEATLSGLGNQQKKDLDVDIKSLCRAHGHVPKVHFSVYKMGSAFLKDTISEVLGKGVANGR